MGGSHVINHDDTAVPKKGGRVDEIPQGLLCGVEAVQVNYVEPVLRSGDRSEIFIASDRMIGRNRIRGLGLLDVKSELRIDRYLV